MENNGLWFEIIRNPVITEKTNKLLADGKITFKVASFSTKCDIKKAIESIFSVKVTKINVFNRKGKIKIFRGHKGKRSDQRFAVVTLEKGQNIDLGIGA